MPDMEIENEIKNIKKRNRRVEIDKAWEVSFIRRFFIGAVTYVIAGIWLVTINDSLPWLKAFIPAGGYILSTLSLPFIKRSWMNKKI